MPQEQRPGLERGLVLGQEQGQLAPRQEQAQVPGQQVPEQAQRRVQERRRGLVPGRLPRHRPRR
jgi:hypothetical protein